MSSQERIPDYFTAGQLEVWREWPEIQKTETIRHGNNFRQSVPPYSYSLDPQRCRDDRVRVAIKSSTSSIVTNLVEKDLELREEAGFPWLTEGLTEARAMRLRRLAQPIVGILTADSLDSCAREKAEMTAIALTGFHMAILGSNDLIDDDRARTVLTDTATHLRQNILCALNETVDA